MDTNDLKKNDFYGYIYIHLTLDSELTLFPLRYTNTKRKIVRKGTSRICTSKVLVSNSHGMNKFVTKITTWKFDI